MPRVEAADRVAQEGLGRRDRAVELRTLGKEVAGGRSVRGNGLQGRGGSGAEPPDRQEQYEYGQERVANVNHGRGG